MSSCWQEDEDSRSQHVLAGLKAAAQFVRDRTEDERIRKAAEHVKWSVNNGFLEEEVYQNVRLVLQEEAKLVSSPDSLVEAVGQGAALTADDVDWLTKRMKGGEVFSDFEDAEQGATYGPNGEPYYAASSSPCASDKVGCDTGDFSSSNSQVSLCFGRRKCPAPYFCPMFSLGLDKDPTAALGRVHLGLMPRLGAEGLALSCARRHRKNRDAEPLAFGVVSCR